MKPFDIYWKIIAEPFIRKSFIKKNRKKFNYSKNYSILASNCIAGEIYHDLGLKFQSPTINIWLTDSDFLKLAQNPKYYFNKEMKFIKEENLSYPIGVIDDIKIYFLHYKTEEEASKKWYERCKRIDYDNIYYIMSDLDLTEEEFLGYQNIKTCKKKIMFTTNPDRAKYSDVFLIKSYKKNSYVKKYAVKRINGFIDFEKFWDFTDWLSKED